MVNYPWKVKDYAVQCVLPLLLMVRVEKMGNIQVDHRHN